MRAVIEWKSCERCRVRLPLGAFKIKEGAAFSYDVCCYECRSTYRTKKVCPIQNAEPAATPIEKQCAKCHQIKSSDCFHKDAAKPDGLNGNCKECRQGIYRSYYEQNGHENRAKSNRWNKANPEKMKASFGRWQIANREKYLQMIRHNAKKRRALKLGSKGSHTRQQWFSLCVHYGNRCLCCGANGGLLTVDHIVPLSKGGSDGIENIQPLCRSCNSRKHTKIVDYRPA